MQIIKKILVINIETQFGGAEKSITDVFKQIVRDEDFEVLFLVENTKMKQLLENSNIKYNVLELGKVNLNLSGIIKIVNGTFRCFFEILKYRPDIVVTNSHVGHVIGGISSIMAFTPFIWVLRDYHLKPIIRNTLGQFASCIICVSDHLKSFYDGNEKYVVVPNGLDVNDLNKNYDLKFREKYGAENEVIYGIASRFVKWKGLDSLIEAFYLADKESGDFHAKLLIAGSAEKGTDEYCYLQDLKKLVKKMGLEHKVIFVGWIDDILEFFYNCDVVVSSSLTTSNGGPESFGRTIIEAWSVKKPVITTDCGGPGFIVTSGETGIKVKENSPDELSKAISTLYGSREKRVLMGIKGFDEVISNYNIEKIKNVYIDILNTKIK